jgi:Rps23 Pro-64 3,4-dihydroxylase Tpa1-like proline 4-hydroxylase
MIFSHSDALKITSRYCYQLIKMKIQKSGKYEWHSDACNQTKEERVLTFIWYLNTKDQDGETDFLYKKIKPHTGKLVIFPATWDYIHRGCPTENKYIITGWIYRSAL